MAMEQISLCTLSQSLMRKNPPVEPLSFHRLACPATEALEWAVVGARRRRGARMEGGGIDRHTLIPYAVGVSEGWQIEHSLTALHVPHIVQ